jgi:hypothetical protein
MTARLALILPLLLLAACSGKVGTREAAECDAGLRIAQKEMEAAKVSGFGGGVEITKAAGLLSAAAVQKTFEKYPNCIDKVQRARAFIREAQVQKK